MAAIGCIGQALVAASRPNIVVIMTDDAGYNEFGFSSALTGQGTQFQTPNLDALAQQSVVARQGYVAHPLCSPSRAAILTGQYPQRYGFENNLATSFTPSVPDTTGLTAANTTMAQHLKGLGYTTGMVGKWHLGYQDGISLPPDKGFDEFYGFWGGGRSYWFSSDNTINLAQAMRRGDAIAETASRTQGNPAEYDSVRGRYITDAFGDEAAAFINDHASDPDPFFLYMPMTAPHTPGEAKQTDLDHFANITDPAQRIFPAMVYAMDRSVGKVRAALEANNVADNTIIVFMNDQGGPSLNDNRPFNGGKGLTWEGGVRVPYLIGMPGLQPGVYDAPISGLDLLPTLYNAAGGNASQLDTDGVDLWPYLTGNVTEQPHESLSFRNNAQWGVRKGDWKLGNPGGSTGTVLFNIATDPRETTNVAAQNPAIVADLLREFTDWEVRLDKPKWGSASATPYKHYVYRTDLLPAILNAFHAFNSGNIWRDAVSSTITGIGRSDSYADLILEFPVKQTGNYFVDASIPRISQQVFMLNEVRFTGNFTGSSNFSATLRESAAIVGTEALLMVTNLDGGGPKIRLEATSSGTSSRFRFNLDNELQLHSDLEITGNGTQDFYINGRIRDFFQPRGVLKTGTSKVTLTGNNTFSGNLQVAGGEVKLQGATAAINGADSIVVGSAGSFVLQSGTVVAHTVDNSAGGSFQFNGGELRVVDFVGNLTNQGGNYSPGASPALSTIDGSYVQTKPLAMLTMELAGTNPGVNYDQLLVNGTATIGGTLKIDLLEGFFSHSGDVYDLIRTTNGVSGTFANTIFPTLSGGRSWRLEYDPFSVRLMVDPQGGGTVGAVPGDYNGNGTVDSADFVVWRNSLNSTTQLAADGDGDGTVDQDDYQMWRANFGRVTPGTGTVGSVPGDYNGNGTVDAADFVVWRNSLSSTTQLAADGDGDGTIDQDDYQLWRVNFGKVAPGASSIPGDYNGNGTVDAADYTVWRNSLNSTTQLAADGDRDGTVDQDDYQMWRANFGKVAPGASAIPGDYNGNGTVDAADYIVWRNSLNSTTQLAADGDRDGTVDQDDYQMWRANFGKFAPTASSNSIAGVPEPGSLLLAFLASFGLASRAFRQRGAT